MKIVLYNLVFLILFVLIGEIIFGYWLSDYNFGYHMRNERNKSWYTKSFFNNQEYNFIYKRNFYGFRGEEFNPKNVKIIFNGGSTGNERFSPEEFTIVGLLNKKLKSDEIDLKIYNASTDGKSLRGIIYDLKYWFPKVKNLEPKYLILYLGLNDIFLNQTDRDQFDFRIKKNTIEKIKDYIKNNSFIYYKFISIKNKYYPKHTFGFFENIKNLYINFDYFDYKRAKELYINSNSEEVKNLLLQYEQRLLILKELLTKNNLIPIFITQVHYDGLKDHRLFLLNEKLKKFSKENNFEIIKLDEIINMGLYDFYDKAHTTPQGSLKIANIIYPYIINILQKKIL